MAEIRIMVVDDDELVRCGVAYMLERLGHDAVLVQSGAEALERIGREEAFDIIVVDLLMPGMDGLETIRRLRQLTATPIIAMSGGGKLVDAHRALKAANKLGIEATLAKPFDTHALNACLAELSPS